MRKILPFFMIVLMFSACTKDSFQPVDNNIPVEEKEISKFKTYEEPGPICGEEIIFDLTGEQAFNGGNVIVTNDEVNLYVTFQANPDWYLIKTGLYVGPESGIPATGGDPELLTYHSSSRTGETSVSYTIPLANLGVCFAIAAAVKVVQFDANGRWINRTYAYITDIPFGDNIWEAYGEYCIQECEQPCYGEETAWSFGTTFTSLTGTKRWGWYSVYTVGTASEYTIFAGQHNDIGTLYVSDDGTTLTVSYQTDGGAVMGLAHLYVGNETEFEDDYMNKKGTPVPGHFPYTQSSDPYVNNFTFNIPLSEINFDGQNLIIAAHAESYLPGECED